MLGARRAGGLRCIRQAGFTSEGSKKVTHPNRPALDTGDAFPVLSFQLVDGGATALPEDGTGEWRVVLLYRGNW